jgi:hypothetical protein
MSRRLIDIENATITWSENDKAEYMNDFEGGVLYSLDYLMEKTPTIDAVELPCKIGDEVWFAKQYKCHKHPRKGVVSEMYFVDDMSLHIVVKSIGRGRWGERVFGTCEEAQAAIDRGCKA